MSSNPSTSCLPENNSKSLRQEKKVKRICKAEIYPKKWTLPENILYARYLKTHLSQMTNGKKKRCGKFLKLANFIGSKTENQCRWHHQKMMLTFNSIQNIIDHVASIKKGKFMQKLNEQELKIQGSQRSESQIWKNIEILRESGIEKIQEETKIEEEKSKVITQINFVPNFTISEEKDFMEEQNQKENDIFDVLNIGSEFDFEFQFF